MKRFLKVLFYSLPCAVLSILSITTFALGFILVKLNHFFVKQGRELLDEAFN